MHIYWKTAKNRSHKLLYFVKSAKKCELSKMRTIIVKETYLIVEWSIVICHWWSLVGGVFSPLANSGSLSQRENIGISPLFTGQSPSTAWNNTPVSDYNSYGSVSSISTGSYCCSLVLFLISMIHMILGTSSTLTPISSSNTYEFIGGDYWEKVYITNQLLNT